MIIIPIQYSISLDLVFWNQLKSVMIVSAQYQHSKSMGESLESIQIDLHSFSDFGGEFELKNLSQLQSIQIGRIGSNSNSFRGSSFVIRGIEMILTILMNRFSKSTIHYFGL